MVKPFSSFFTEEYKKNNERQVKDILRRVILPIQEALRIDFL